MHNPDFLFRTSCTPHQGMPPLSQEEAEQLSYFEVWPGWKFYFPMAFYVGWLALRYGGLTTSTLANPMFDYGGVVGESKHQILDLVAKTEAKKYLPQMLYLKADEGFKDILKKIKDHDLNYPFIAKPDSGCRSGGVQVIHDKNNLKTYLDSFPEHENLILQELVNHEAEFGVFYARDPETDESEIFSLTMKYFPYVKGDGVSTLKELIMADPRASKISYLYLPRLKDFQDIILENGVLFRLAYAGSHCRGAIFKDGAQYISKEMISFFDTIARQIPEFYFGRIDVRVPDIKSLETGEGLKIIEVNGATSEATHIWDSKTTLKKAYKDQMYQYKKLFEIGSKNRKRGFKPDSLPTLLKQLRHHETLMRAYPVTS